ncbi:MAG: hypothetical protein M0C28_02775 [Candidatus Moduliflexus flocculans]|nr:hypothetical protein [Candidatus Moduliflexus flocculans]
MVPATVEREFQGSRGSAQLWIEPWNTTWRPSSRRSSIRRASRPCISPVRLCLQRAFDNLISNEDRHQRNYLIMDDWRMILIDHSRTFRTTKKFTTRPDLRREVQGRPELHHGRRCRGPSSTP